MTDSKLQDLLKDRETMPVYDESIFDPEKAVRDLCFTGGDINDLCEFFRWHINQRERGIKMKSFIALLRARRDQQMLQKKFDLIKELELLEQFAK
jgi:hypothetical protein